MSVSVTIPNNSIQLSVPTTVSLTAKKTTSQQPQVASGVATSVILEPTQFVGEASELVSGRMVNIEGFGLAIKDEARNKILSVERVFMTATRVGFTQNMALRVDGIPTTLNQFGLLKNATVLSVSVTQRESINTEYQIKLIKDDTTTIGTIPVTAGTTSLIQTGLNYDVDCGEKLTIFLSADEPIENPMVLVELAWRK